MSRRARLLVAAAVLLGVAIAFDARLAQRVLASRAEAAAVSRRYAELVRRLHFGGRPDARGADAAGGRVRRKDPAAAASAAGAAAPAEVDLNARQVIGSDAELSKRYMGAFSAGFDVEYGLFIRMLGLSPADAAQFRDLMASIEANKLKVAQTSAEEGLDADDPQMKALRAQLNSPDWTDMKQLLGPAGMSALRQYGSEWPTVTLVQNFGATVPDSPLTVDQAQELLSVLSAASRRDASGTVIPDTVNAQQALASAAPILGSDQLFILSAMLQESEAKAKISLLSAGH